MVAFLSAVRFCGVSIGDVSNGSEDKQYSSFLTDDDDDDDVIVVACRVSGSTTAQ